jgi:hypothetical protein
VPDVIFVCYSLPFFQRGSQPETEHAPCNRDPLRGALATRWQHQQAIQNWEPSDLPGWLTRDVYVNQVRPALASVAKSGGHREVMPMAISVKCTVDDVEIVLSLDEPPQVDQSVEINGVKRKITKVYKNRFMHDPPTFSIEVE